MATRARKKKPLGIRRKKAGSRFSYRGPDGRTIKDPAELDRIRSLAIPPAYTEVWICPIPNGHIQATGRDARPVVRLLDCTGIRIGNDEYARSNRSFGLTTLRDRHVEISGSNIRFEFRELPVPRR